MTPDLKFLAWSVALTFVQVVVAVIGANTQVSLATLVGNREGLGEFPGWPGRAARAHRNMIENLALFTALVLIAQIAGRTNATTALGAALFFWSRLAYAIIYVVGIPWLRTLAWTVATVGLILIFSQLL